MSLRTYKIVIKGIVQGVGFRPFILKLATQHNINGSVSNNKDGVIIDLVASKEKSLSFLKTILQSPPSSSIITDYEIKVINMKAYHSFQIIPTPTNENINTPLTPDFAICKDCKAEIKDAKNRRYHYPFTTCVKCGPRYAITKNFPFNRATTTLSDIKMCAACNGEYLSLEDERTHAQTNTCPRCGFNIVLCNNDGKQMSANTEIVLDTLAKKIKTGDILAIKNTNGYLLCCDATNPDAIKRLRKKKHRPNKPFALLYPTLEAVKKDFNVTPKASTVLQSAQCPIVLLDTKGKKTTLRKNEIAPGLKRLGVMLPTSSLMYLIATACKKPLIATSGNIHGSAIVYTEDEACKQLKNIADYFLHHRLPINFPQDDSVVSLNMDQSIIIRRSRGYAPNFFYKKKVMASHTLAMGAHLKSTITYVPNQYIYTSQYLGNLDDYSVHQRLQETIDKYISLFNIVPTNVLIDQHPDYQSTVLGKVLAKQWGAKYYSIQHHEAHFCSVLAEYDLFSSSQKVLGVIWDGIGLGTDHAIWGGEFFVYHQNSIHRVQHFEYFDWIINDKMPKEPRLSLLSLTNKENRNTIKHKFTEQEWRIYNKYIENNTLKTSSVGRLFDAVASLLSLKDYNTYEGEAALILEETAIQHSGAKPIDLLEGNTNENPSPHPIIDNLFLLLKKNYDIKHLAYSFIYTLSKLIIDTALSHNISTVACSGGVFQNALLLHITKSLASKYKISVVHNMQLSPNDENISLGQIMYYENIGCEM